MKPLQPSSWPAATGGADFKPSLAASGLLREFTKTGIRVSDVTSTNGFAGKTTTTTAATAAAAAQHHHRDGDDVDAAADDDGDDGHGHDQYHDHEDDANSSSSSIVTLHRYSNTIKIRSAARPKLTT